MVLVPLALTFFSSFSESVQRWLFGGYEIRWQVDKAESDRRTQLITVRNNGSTPLYKAHIHLTIASNKRFPVADFSFARLPNGPQISFFDSLARLDFAPNAAQADLKQLVTALDSHSNPKTLFALEEAYNTILLSSLRANKQLRGTLTDLENTIQNHDDWHSVWPSRCKVAPAACQQGSSSLEGWEASRLQLLEKGRQKWFESTGVELIPNNSRLSPSGDVDFAFDLGTKESCFLQVHYNPDPSSQISAEVQVLSGSGIGTSEVVDQRDLATPLPLFMFKYHFHYLVAVVLVLIAVLWFSWPVLRPKQLLPIHKVFRHALRTDDQEYWEHAYQRFRFFVNQEFRDLRQAVGKPYLKPESEELLDYVRNSLIKRYGDNPSELVSEKKLKQFISARLEDLVALAA